jgi:hypothetical protein
MDWTGIKKDEDINYPHLAVMANLGNDIAQRRISAKRHFI